LLLQLNGLFHCGLEYISSHLAERKVFDVQEAQLLEVSHGIQLNDFLILASGRRIRIIASRSVLLSLPLFLNLQAPAPHVLLHHLSSTASSWTGPWLQNLPACLMRLIWQPIPRSLVSGSLRSLLGLLLFSRLR